MSPAGSTTCSWMWKDVANRVDDLAGDPDPVPSDAGLGPTAGFPMRLVGASGTCRVSVHEGCREHCRPGGTSPCRAVARLSLSLQERDSPLEVSADGDAECAPSKVSSQGRLVVAALA